LAVAVVESDGDVAGVDAVDGVAWDVVLAVWVDVAGAAA